MTARILLVVSDDRARETFSGYLRGLPAGYSLSTAPDGRAALDMLRSAPVDAVIFGSGLPNSEFPSLARRISTEYSHVKILIIAGDSRCALILDAFDAGAVGYLLTEQFEAEIGAALRTVFSGKTYLSPRITRGTPLKTFLKELRRTYFQEIFTRTELAVLKCIQMAMSNRRIAETLHISVSTVKTHKTHIMDKLGIRNAPEIMKYLAEHDIFS